jgi:hypothetical protein
MTAAAFLAGGGMGVAGGYLLGRRHADNIQATGLPSVSAKPVVRREAEARSVSPQSKRDLAEGLATIARQEGRPVNMRDLEAEAERILQAEMEPPTV